MTTIWVVGEKLHTAVAPCEEAGVCPYGGLLLLNNAHAWRIW